MIGGSTHHAQHGRLGVLWGVIYVSGAVLILRTAQLQVLEAQEYRLAAERNRSQIIYQTAPRGRLYDRHGTAVATNRAAFSLIYLPPKKTEHPDLRPLAKELSRHLKTDPAELLETLQQALREETAVRLAENLPTRTMFQLSELKTIYPGVDLIVEARRHYPFGAFASHLIGYMGKMDSRSWKNLKSKGYRVDSKIGKMGMEAVFERELKGRDGGIRMEVDAQGRLKRILDRIPWHPGSNVHLTIDAAVQKAADEGLRTSLTGRGAVVAIDPRSGDILALSSAPDFDSNALLSSDADLAQETMAALPEFNRAIAGTYPPGSAFKPIVGIAALNEKKVAVSDEVFCPGYYESGKRLFLCWEHKGHKRVSWYSGLTHSCDVYFYRMGIKTGGPLIEKYSRLFGLGRKTNIALAGEKRGNVFGPSSKPDRAWYEGDTLNLAIGQGELLVTPIQMAVMAAAIANRGVVWRPHFTTRIEYTEGRPEFKQAPEQVSTVSLSDRTWREIHDAMLMVVSSGTGRAAQIKGLEVAGKTGTAQNPGKDHAWFISYAGLPGQTPSVAVAVLVEEGEHGSSAAAPIARKVMMAALGISDPVRKPQTAPPPEDAMLLRHVPAPPMGGARP